MRDDSILKTLYDWHTLRLAYAASSDYVMRAAFQRTKEFEVFRGATDLAHPIQAQYKRLASETADTVVLGAHLYALELAGAREAIRSAVVFTLETPHLRADPRLAQFAGKVGAGLLAPGRHVPAGTELSDGELTRIHMELKRAGG